MRKTILYAAVAALCLLPGCKREPDVVPVSSHLRLLKVGDKWSYKVQAKLHLPAGLLNAPNLVPKAICGTATDYVAEGKFVDHYDLCMVHKVAIDEPELAADSMVFISQNPGTHDITALGDNRGRSHMLRKLMPPAVLAPGRWTQGMQHTCDLGADDGERVRETITVLGVEDVKTAIGTFKTWKTRVVTDAVHDDASAHVEAIQWWAPQLGNNVKEEAWATFSMGLKAEVSTEIVSTTVPSSEYSDSSLVR